MLSCVTPKEPWNGTGVATFVVPFRVAYQLIDHCVRQAFITDPVSTQKLTTFIANCYATAAQICGGEQVLQSKYLHDVDPTVYQQIMKEFRSN